MFWFGLTIGLIVGVFSGVAFVSLMIVGKEADEKGGIQND